MQKMITGWAGCIYLPFSQPVAKWTNSLLSSRLLDLASGCAPRGFPTNILNAQLVFPIIGEIWFSVTDFTVLVVLGDCKIPCYAILCVLTSSLVDRNVYMCTLFWHTCNLCSLRSKGHVSQPYKTISKVIFFWSVVLWKVQMMHYMNWFLAVC